MNIMKTLILEVKLVLKTWDGWVLLLFTNGPFQKRWVVAPSTVLFFKKLFTTLFHMYSRKATSVSNYHADSKITVYAVASYEYIFHLRSTEHVNYRTRPTVNKLICKWWVTGRSEHKLSIVENMSSSSTMIVYTAVLWNYCKQQSGASTMM